MSIVLQQSEIDRSLKRISHEIIERNHGVDSIVLLGIPTRGVTLAQRIGAILTALDTPIPVGTLDITMYRDDLRLRPPRALMPTQIPAGGLQGKDLILVDDVLYSGRTIRAALDAISALGRPRSVQLAVLIDRGHRELPIRADYVGKNIPTSLQESVRVQLTEIDGIDQVEVGI
ncbi:MAG: bifunctional pyr operon transcriptional regulator/uracil phosphoribosyltransferase PyrR [Actinomycetota bacterium]